MFNHAIVCPPSSSFSKGLTSAQLGEPVLELAQEQHAAYCTALKRCGIDLIKLDPDPQYPDSTFVEDTAVLTRNVAIITRPGAASRRGEVSSIQARLRPYYSSIFKIQSPGTLEGGDVCQVESHYLIGISERTNEEGAQQLAGFLERDGFQVSLVDLLKSKGLLHLKSGIAYLGDGQIVLCPDLENFPLWNKYEIIPVDPEEGYAANCVRVNEYVLLAAGYPRMAAKLSTLGYRTIALEMSEFQKMDGGLSCLSLRF